MARKPIGQPIHGWIVLDKPPGMTSSHAVGMLRRLIDAAKAGHGGTLDPLATGVLPVALGEATKTMAYAVAGRKVYRFALRWGEARDTDDADGRITATSAIRPTREAILAALPSFAGIIDQRPPDYSAIKVAGERAYDLARQGVALDLAARRVVVDRLDLLDMPDPDTAAIRGARSARARIFGRWRAIWAGRLAAMPISRHCAACRSAVSPSRRRFPWINWLPWAIVW